MRKLVFNLHLYTALIAGTFIVILGLTGSVMAFEPEIDHLCHWRLDHVTARPPALSLAEISAVVSKKFPAGRIVDYGISTSPGLSYQIGLQNRETVYVNQYTGAVLGTRTGPDFIDALQNDVHQFHLRLLVMPRGREKDPGKTVMTWAGVAILFLLLSGLYLWWPLKRARIQAGARTRAFWFDLHNVVGIFSLVFLLVLTVTGVIIGFDDRTVPFFYRITGTEPSRPPRIQIAPPPDAKPITPDQALEIARDALPGASPFDVNVPPPRGAYQIRSRFPEDLTPGGRSMVIVDQYSGRVLYAQGSRTAPGGRRLETANRAFHTGDAFGIPSKILMSLMSLMAPTQLLTGIIMWWNTRKPHRSARQVEHSLGERKEGRGGGGFFAPFCRVHIKRRT